MTRERVEFITPAIGVEPYDIDIMVRLEIPHNEQPNLKELGDAAKGEVVAEEEN